MTTFACVWVQGHVPFTAEYVVRLRALVRRWYDAPHRFVCFTDRPRELPADMDVIEIKPFAECFAWWAKLHLFRPGNGLSGRVVYLDLDTLPVSSLRDIVNYPAEVAFIPDAAPNFTGRGSRKVVKKFNTSVMVFHAGQHSELFTEWTGDVEARLWGDQDWVGEKLPQANKMPLAWFPRLSEIHDGAVIPDDARVVLCKKPKNEDAAARWPWFNQLWREDGRTGL